MNDVIITSSVIWSLSWLRTGGMGRGQIKEGDLPWPVNSLPRRVYSSTRVITLLGLVFEESQNTWVLGPLSFPFPEPHLFITHKSVSLFFIEITKEGGKGLFLRDVSMGFFRRRYRGLFLWRLTPGSGPYDCIHSRTVQSLQNQELTLRVVSTVTWLTRVLDPSVPPSKEGNPDGHFRKGTPQTEVFTMFPKTDNGAEEWKFLDWAKELEEIIER